jgi:hypothetical protein
LVGRVEDVGLYSYDGGVYSDRELQRFGHVDVSAPVGVFHGFPSDVGDRFWNHPFRVGGFVCETDRIPPSWVEVCNRMDLVYVPSTFCQQAFRQSGVRTPLMVVPHGLEPEYRPARRMHREQPMRFYNSIHASSTLERKGIDSLVGCFLEAFGPSGRDARLVLRTELSTQLIEIRQRHDFGSAITLLPLDPLPTDQFAALYSEFHCTVHPSRGEGFGLIPLQSIACETPVIATAATGMVDYLDESNSLPLRTSGQVPARYVGHATGNYFEIDEDHLVELLGDVHRHWEDHYDRVRRAAPAIRTRFRWSTVLAELLEIVHAAAMNPEDGEDLKQRLEARYGPDATT